MAKVIGREFSNVNRGVIDEDGYWNVLVLLTETIFYDDETQEVEAIECRTMDKDFETAHQVALQSALIQYRQEVVDRKLTSLVEARKRYGRLNDSNKDNSSTITQ